MAKEKSSEKFRCFETSSGKCVLAGKSAEQNELLVEQSGDSEVVLHTKEAGSPFCNIKGKASKKDIEEAAVFCAKFSQAWKKAKVKKDIEVNFFLGKDIFKTAEMKIGTFGIKKCKTIIVKKEDIEKFC